MNARLEGFARESLKAGHGEWWIVSEMVRRSSEVDETQAREIVARVAPQIHREFVRRRRSFFRCGLMVVGLSLFTLIKLPGDPHVPLFSILGMIIGSFLMAHGWPGVRRLRSGDAPTSLPGSVEPGPVRTGLGWRAEPFEWK
jgi:hypothetical protein